MENESVFQVLELIKENWPDAWRKLEPEVILFLKIGEQLEESIIREAVKFNILEVDFKVLFRLRACGIDIPQSPTSLYTNIGVTSGGLTKILHRLEVKGHVARIANPDDGRSTLVKITLTGVQLIEDMFAGIVERDQRYLSVLSKEERKNMTTLCEKLIRNYSEG